MSVIRPKTLGEALIAAAAQDDGAPGGLGDALLAHQMGLPTTRAPGPAWLYPQAWVLRPPDPRPKKRRRGLGGAPPQMPISLNGPGYPGMWA